MNLNFPHTARLTDAEIDGLCIAMARSQSVRIINGRTADHRKNRSHLCLTQSQRQSLNGMKTGMNFEMNYFEAMRILDKVADGICYPEKIINQALEATGDIDGQGTPKRQRSEGVDCKVQEEATGRRQGRSIRVVAEDIVGHSQKAWSVVC